MQIRFGNRRHIQFTDKYHPPMGIVSLCVGVAALGLLLTLFFLSGFRGGSLGEFAGYLGLLDLFVSMVGFILAVRCYRQDEIYVITPMIGSMLNGMLVIADMILYVIGSV